MEIYCNNSNTKEILVILDEVPNEARLMQFASQVGVLTSEQLADLNKLWAGEKSSDFMLGLVAGYANSLVIAKAAGDNVVNQLGPIVAFVADKWVEKS